MIEKLEQKTIHMNFKKAEIIFLITCAALVITVPAALYGNFQNRIAVWEHDGETDREHGENERDFKERGLEDIYGKFHLSWGDLILLAGCVVAGIALGIWYWLLVTAWVYRKAYRMGVNGRLAALGALFFNLAAAAALYLYAAWKGTCANCGRVRDGNGKFCDRCGNPLMKECPQCRQEMNMLSAYCSNCGKNLNESQ